MWASSFARPAIWRAGSRWANDPVVCADLVPAEQHALLARQACPLVPKVHLLLAELSVIHADGNGSLDLQRVEQLVPSNTDLLNKCATLELWAGHTDQACRVWKRALAIEDYFVSAALFVCQRVLTPRQIVEDVLPDSPLLLVKLAQQCCRDEKQAVFCDLLVKRAAQLLDRCAAARGPVANTFGPPCKRWASNFINALASYHRLLRCGPGKSPGDLNWPRCCSSRESSTKPSTRPASVRGWIPATPAYRELLEAIHDKRLRGDLGVPPVSSRP